MVAHFPMRTKDKYKNYDEKIGTLEESDLSIEVANHSQRFFTLIKNNHFRFIIVIYVINVRKNQNYNGLLPLSNILLFLADKISAKFLYRVVHIICSFE